MGLWNDLVAPIFCCNLLHEIDDSIKHVPVLVKCALLFLRTHEEKFGVFLPRSALHLNECLDCQELVEANNLVASRDVKALLNDIRCDQDVQTSLPESV